MVVRAGLAENRELRKKAERLAAVEAERDMLEKQLDDVVLERDTNKKDLAEADKAIAAQGTTIATLESKLTQKEDAIALVAAKDKEIEKMKEARAKEKIDEANEKMNLRRQSAERAKTKATALEDKLDTVKAENDALRRDLAARVRGRDGEVAPLRAAREEGRAGQGAPRCQVQGLGDGRRREADGVARRPPRVSLYSSRAAAVRAVIPHLLKSQS